MHTHDSVTTTTTKKKRDRERIGKKKSEGRLTEMNPLDCVIEAEVEFYFIFKKYYNIMLEGFIYVFT